MEVEKDKKKDSLTRLNVYYFEKKWTAEKYLSWEGDSIR